MCLSHKDIVVPDPNEEAPDLAYELKRMAWASKCPIHLDDYLCYSTRPNDPKDVPLLAKPPQQKSSSMLIL